MDLRLVSPTGTLACRALQRLFIHDEFVRDRYLYPFFILVMHESLMDISTAEYGAFYHAKIWTNIVTLVALVAHVELWTVESHVIPQEAPFVYLTALLELGIEEKKNGDEQSLTYNNQVISRSCNAGLQLLNACYAS